MFFPRQSHHPLSLQQYLKDKIKVVKKKKKKRKKKKKIYIKNTSKIKFFFFKISKEKKITKI